MLDEHPQIGRAGPPDAATCSLVATTSLEKAQIGRAGPPDAATAGPMRDVDGTSNLISVAQYRQMLRLQRDSHGIRELRSYIGSAVPSDAATLPIVRSTLARVSLISVAQYRQMLRRLGMRLSTFRKA